MQSSYNPSNWYWIVAGSTTQVWSSARVEYVTVSDATYEAWLAAGNSATKIDSEASLADVLAAQYPAGWPATLAQQAQAALANGLTISSTSTPAINGTYSTSANAQANFTSSMLYVLVHSQFPGGASSMPWVLANGSVVTIPSTTVFQAIATAVANYVAVLTQIILTDSGTLPSASVTIA